ncbi:MAG: phosphatase PAP2 family protein [Bacteroidaceae bacterium]|nr:phosphatase PAP2 family protein [Bacteroidaceae bacterium]
MKSVILIARILSSVFRPSYYPTVGMLILIFFTYLSLFPLRFKLWLLALVLIFTLCLPALGTFIYRRIHGWSSIELRKQHKRIVPYFINICCYLYLMHIFNNAHMPFFVTAIISISLLIQCTCIIVNIWWKVSMHAAGSGGVIGAIIAYSAIFGFNPIWWLSLAVFVSGCVMTSRMILRQHTLGQVIGGTLIGIVCGIVGTMFM